MPMTQVTETKDMRLAWRRVTRSKMHENGSKRDRIVRKNSFIDSWARSGCSLKQ